VYVPARTFTRWPAAAFVIPSASVHAPLAPLLVFVVPLPPPAASDLTYRSVQAMRYRVVFTATCNTVSRTPATLIASPVVAVAER
jgi:hypothetical protein